MFTERLAALLSAVLAVRRQHIQLSIAAASVAVDVSIVTANQAEGVAVWNAVGEWTLPVLSSALGTTVERLAPPTLVFIPYQALSPPLPPESQQPALISTGATPETNASLTLLPSATSPEVIAALLGVAGFLGSAVVGIALLRCWWKRRQQARTHGEVVLTRPQADVPSAPGEVVVSGLTIGALQTPDSMQRRARGLASVYESPASDYEDAILESRKLRARRALLGALNELRTLPDTSLARDSEEPWNATRRAQGSSQGLGVHGISVRMERLVGPSIGILAEESTLMVDGAEWPPSEEEAVAAREEAADAIEQASGQVGVLVVPQVQAHLPSQSQPMPQPIPLPMPMRLSRAFKVGRRLSLRHAIASWMRHGQRTLAHARNAAIIAAVRQIYADHSRLLLARQLSRCWVHWVRTALDWSAEHGRLLLARRLFLRRQMLRQAMRKWRHRSAHFLTPDAPLASVERPAACHPRSALRSVPSLRI